MRPFRTSFAPFVLLLAIAGCSRFHGGSSSTADPARLPADADLSQVPMGALPGQPVTVASSIANPFEGDAQAASEGKALFASMNCVYCHGAEGSGLMGPPLNAPAWRYGGTPAEIYRSIRDGRPQGMPAWGSLLPADQIWKLTAYIETLGAAAPPASPKMSALAPPAPSTTGPEPADQSQADSAQQALVAARAEHRR